IELHFATGEELRKMRIKSRAGAEADYEAHSDTVSATVTLRSPVYWTTLTPDWSTVTPSPPTSNATTVFPTAEQE
ncbi:hypothetical protein CIB48_g11968, partial [Xylaria polymorpha]